MNCRTLEQRTRDALTQLDSQASVEKVTDLDGMMAYGVMRTPGLVIDERLVWQGGVPTVEKIKELITANVQASR